MTLVADSGSTKTTWMEVESGNMIVTDGLNPHFTSEEQFIAACDAVRRNFQLPAFNFPLFFYGAGCGLPAQRQKVAEWLEKCPKVGWVNYCGLPSNKYYALAQKYLPNGGCGVIAFGLKGTREEAIKFMDQLDFISIVTHVADVRTCVLHPASHTHRQLSDEQLREAGVAPDLIRLSVGIENADDIIADLQQAMDKM